MFNISKELLGQWDFGKHDQRPVAICASINTRGFGEFIYRLLYVNTVAEQFDKSHVSLIFRNDAPFKKDVARLLPHAVDVEIAADALLPNLDLVSPRNVRVLPGFEQWFKYKLTQQDLVITEGMATETGLIAFDYLGYLRVPAEDVPACTDALIKYGVDPNRWFCTLHARESGYLTAARGQVRNADLETYYQTTVHIIRNLGGQVVRLGHPEMTQFGPMEGLIELGCEPDSTFLQAFAVSRSRYLVCGPSGPVAFGDAFNVPVAYANAVSPYFCNHRAIARTIDLQAPDGAILNQERYVHATTNGLNPLLANGYQVLQISTDEMKRLVNRVHETTGDTTGWRTPEVYTGPRPNKLVWPGNFRSRATFLEVPG